MTIGIRVRSEPGELVFGIGASVWGFGSATKLVSGEAVESVFHDVLASGIGQGLENRVAGSLSESTCCGPGSAVRYLNAIIGMNLETGITLTQPIPEPGTSPLPGLGPVGLACASRSRSLR